MAQKYVPTFEDWNTNMTFQGSTAARGNAKYYNEFLKDLQNRPQYYDAIMGQHGLGAFAADIAAPELPEGFEVPEGPSAEDLKAAQATRDETARVTQGGLDRDAAFSQYTNAADAAASAVDKRITAQQSQAALSGVEFLMTPELRQERINNEFATSYSSSAYENLVNLYDEFGSPKGEGGYEDFITVRGEAVDTDAATANNAKASTGRTARGTRATLSTLAGRPEDNQLGSVSILGGG